ncbi:MAG: hypothetical protein SAMD01599839_25000 [Rectinema sp.]
MKKLIVLLLALAMVGAVFADDQKAVATFGAYLDSYGDFMDGAGPTLYSETYYNYSSGGVGFSATVTGAEDIFAKVRNYSVSYQVLPELKVLAGRLRETGGARLTSYVDGNGFSTRMANVQNGMMGQVSYMGVGLAVFSTLDKIDNTNVGLSYTVKDVAKVVGGYLGTSDEFWVGADVLAVKGVTARLGFRNTPTKSYIYATAGSSSLVDKLKLGLDTDVVLSPFAVGAKVKAEYALTDKYSAGAKVSFDNGDAWNGNNGLNAKAYGVMNFAQGDIVLGLQYDVASTTFSIPFDFEVWF